MTETYTGAHALKNLADHFAPRDWAYTRMHKIKRIRYTTDYSGRNSIPNRLKHGLPALFKPRKRHAFLADREVSLWWRLVGRFYLFKAHMVEDNVPDGILNRGSVITFWEEDGEYIELVQPTVGSLLADFLLEDPTNPHAQKILAEIDRIRAASYERWKAGEVDGETHD